MLEANRIAVGTGSLTAKDRDAVTRAWTAAVEAGRPRASAPPAGVKVVRVRAPQAAG